MLPEIAPRRIPTTSRAAPRGFGEKYCTLSGTLSHSLASLPRTFLQSEFDPAAARRQGSLPLAALARDAPGALSASFYMIPGRLSYPLYILHYPLTRVFSKAGGVARRAMES